MMHVPVSRPFVEQDHLTKVRSSTSHSPKIGDKLSCRSCPHLGCAKTSVRRIFSIHHCGAYLVSPTRGRNILLVSTQSLMFLPKLAAFGPLVTVPSSLPYVFLLSVRVPLCFAVHWSLFLRHCYRALIRLHDCPSRRHDMRNRSIAVSCAILAVARRSLHCTFWTM